MMGMPEDMSREEGRGVLPASAVVTACTGNLSTSLALTCADPGRNAILVSDYRERIRRPADSAESSDARGHRFVMAFFKRELSPIERFETALRDRRVARQKLADRLGIAETTMEEKRAAAERLAVAGAASAKLDRADANMRAVE